MSVSDIQKLKDHAAIFHPKMFNDLLFKSFHSSRAKYTFADHLVGIGRGAERTSATAMYTTFYNPISGFANMTQQI